MPYSTPTVLIETDNGPVRIDECDYNPEIHTLVSTPAPAPVVPETPAPAPVVPETPAPAPVVPETSVPTPAVPETPVPTPAVPETPVPVAGHDEPLALGVMKNGAKHFVVNAANPSDVHGNPEGYPSKAKAEAAARELMAVKVG